MLPRVVVRENIKRTVEMIKDQELSWWLECAEVEAVPGRCGGRPTIKGTRIEPDGIVGDFDLGSSVEEIHENFPTVPIDRIKKLIAFAHDHQPV
jgi:uncharacterized protein (DUF433 family)